MSADVPGWYGKLPSLGDFASRRLSPLFIEPWDRWLASGLASWRESDTDWLDAFLAAPTWRFALGAGIPFDASPGYTGVLMPSVDRVGRYFPLTVARPKGRYEVEVPASWLRGIEERAVAALHDDWSAERFDAELGSLEEVDDAGPPWPDAGQTLWWHECDGELSAPVTLVGLPESGDLARLLSGRFGAAVEVDPGDEP